MTAATSAPRTKARSAAAFGPWPPQALASSVCRVTKDGNV